MSEDLSGSTSGESNDWQNNWSDECRQRLQQHRYGRRLQVGRRDVVRGYDPGEYVSALGKMEGDINKALAIKSACPAVQRDQEPLGEQWKTANEIWKQSGFKKSDADETLQKLTERKDKVTSGAQKFQEFTTKNTTNGVKAAFTMLDKANLPQDKKGTVDAARMSRNVAITLAERGDFDMANQRLDEAEQQAREALADILAESQRRYDAVKQGLNGILLGIEKKNFGDPPTPSLKKPLEDFADYGTRCRDAMSQPPETIDFIATMDLIEKVEQAIPEIRELVDDAMTKMGGTAKTEADKKLAIGALQAKFGIEIDQARRCECGVSTLEGGAKCPTCKKKVTVPVYSSKMLPKLYDLLNGLPEGHVVDNPSLLKVRRTRESDASWFESGSKTVVLNLKQTTGVRGFVNNVGHTLSNPHYTGKGDWLVNEFEDFAYHEVAHAVDDKTGYMATHGKEANHGGWVTTSPEEVLQLALEKKEFRKDFPDYSGTFLKAYLTSAAAGKKPEKEAEVTKSWDDAKEVAALIPSKEDFLRHPAIVAALDFRTQHLQVGEVISATDLTERGINNEWKVVQKEQIKTGAARDAFKFATIRVGLENVPPDKVHAELLDLYGSPNPPKAPDWKRLAKHDAVDWIKHVYKSKGESGLWDGGTSAAKKYAIDDKYVYQQAYSNSWWRYDLAARDTMVVDYQFRAPGEWFAEAYAAHHIGKLPKNHPIAVWLKSDEGKEAPLKK